MYSKTARTRRRPAPAPELAGLRRRVATLEAAQDNLLGQLRLAERVQRAMLPRELPRAPGAELGAALRPTHFMSGDFYNAFRLDAHRVGLYLGDVMGHGPAAALLSVFVMQSVVPKRIIGHSYEILPPAEVLGRLNRDVLAAEFPEQPFLTMVYAVLDLDRLTLTYACAGHPSPLLLRAGEPPRPLPGTAPLLGVFEAEVAQAEVALRPGDRLLIYSDGVLTARWTPFGRGLDALVARLDDARDHTLNAAAAAALSAAAFDAGHEDDLAVLMARIGGG